MPEVEMEMEMAGLAEAGTNPRVIAFDFGLKRIGTAVGNIRTGTSQGLHVVRARDGRPDWGEIEQLLAEWRPAELVVGLPLNMDGEEGAMVTRARQFGERARKRFGLEVVFVDERLSTVGAETLLEQGRAPGKSLRRKRLQCRDSLAAELILQTHLEARRSRV